MFFNRCVSGGLALAAMVLGSTFAQEGAVSLNVTNGATVLDLPKIPGTQEYKVLWTPDLNVGFSVIGQGTLTGFTWSNLVTGSQGFYRAEAVPMATNDMLSALVLNRLAYGPTPDEIERVKAIGADAWMNEQLAPETIVESLDMDQVNTNRNWQRVVITGTATSKDFYIYLTAPGDVYLDDLKMVAGTNPDGAGNFFANGDFETQPLTNSWTVSTNLSDSFIDTAEKHGGASSLHVIASSAGSTKASAIWQTLANVTVGNTYTLSYWWKPGTNMISNATLRFSGSGIVSSPDTIATKLASSTAGIDDLRAWHVLHAIRSKKQLEETLLQFLENHFVTQVSKTRDYFDNVLNDNSDWLSTRTEYNEIQRWRAALENPSCTFSNLLKISAESIAQIIYLDTVNSRGDGTQIANENYARELLELYTFGVDNGYDQNDITLMSHAWTGWSTRLVDATNEFNPFAPQSTTLKPGGTNVANLDNLVGVWAFGFKGNRHYVRAATTIFPGKTVPARFGAPWAGRNYELTLPIRTGTNGIQDGYDVIKHLSNQPFTEEFISVKLCRLFVHENFVHGVYDYTDPNMPAEAKLVHDCMIAWENTGGNIREVLKVIFNSSLFRSELAAMHKVKTPLEFTVSAIRTLRSENADGTATANTDGYAIKDPINRMGAMKLFDRAEPNGYPEQAAPWISAGTLAERLRWIQAFCIAPSANGHADAGSSTSDPVGLLKKKLPSAQWNDAAAVADYFLGIILPGEGKANLDLYRNAAINFLNTADNGTTASPFSALVNTTATYDTRVRGMVAAIMTSQRFHEQ